MITKRFLGFMQDPERGTLPVELEARFDPQLPLELRFDFGKDNVWVFYKDLLVIGAAQPVGEGDVRIAPAEDEMVRVTLDSPFGHAVMDLPLMDVLAYLGEVSTAMATQDEDRKVLEELDRWIDKTLGVTD